jgi:hypothetical protein
MKMIRYYLALLLSLGLVLAPVSTAHAGLETGTYVSDLNTSNPVNGDPVSQGAAHLRLIKTVLQATFPDADAPIYGLRSGTAQTLSGASVDFTSIPSWAKRITLSLVGASTNGSVSILFQLGDSGGIETSGYLSSSSHITGTGTDSANFSSGFGFSNGGASNAVHGSITFVLVNASTNTWAANGTFGRSDNASNNLIAGSKSLSGTLDRIRITTTGAATFDAGSANILYE